MLFLYCIFAANINAMYIQTTFSESQYSTLNTNKERKAYDKGAECCNEGGSITDCEYSEIDSLELYIAWVMGFNEVNSNNLL